MAELIPLERLIAVLKERPGFDEFYHKFTEILQALQTLDKHGLDIMIYSRVNNVTLEFEERDNGEERHLKLVQQIYEDGHYVDKTLFVSSNLDDLDLAVGKFLGAVDNDIDQKPIY